MAPDTGALERAEARQRARRAALRQAKSELSKAQKTVAFAQNQVERSKRWIRRLRRATGVGAAMALSAKHVGTTESPPFSNRGPLVDRMVGTFTQVRGIAWCGAAVGYWLKHAGVKGLTERVLYVPYIIADAKACRNGFAGPVDTRRIKKGDLVCMDFGTERVEGEHVGLAIADFDPRTDSVRTREGNTSSTQSGSQANGGGVYERTRKASLIVCGARPRYPR